MPEKLVGVQFVYQ